MSDAEKRKRGANARDIVADPHGLDIRERLFVNEYLIDLNGHRAALRTGFAPSHAKQSGSELLARPQVAAAIAHELEQRRKRTGITAERVLRELAICAFSDIGEIVDDSEGSIRIRSLQEMPSKHRRAIESIVEKPTPNGVERKVKLHSKLGALTKLIDHLGLNAPIKVDVSDERTADDIRNKSTAEIAAEIAKLREENKGG